MMVKVIDSVLNPISFLDQPQISLEPEYQVQPEQVYHGLKDIEMVQQFNNQLKIPSFINKAIKMNHKKLLSFNTILEQNQEYDQSSISFSANQMSQFQSELGKMNINSSQIGTSYVYPEMLYRKNTLGGIANNPKYKDSQIEQSFFRRQLGRQKTLNLPVSKSNLDSVRSEGSQVNISQSSYVSQRNREKSKKHSGTSFKNPSAKYQELHSPLLPDTHHSMEINHNLLRQINSLSQQSKQSVSIEISYDEKQQLSKKNTQLSQNSGLKSAGSIRSRKLVKEFPAETIFQEQSAPEGNNILSMSITEQSDNGIKIGCANLDSSSLTPKVAEVKKQKIKSVYFRNNSKQYIYSHDYDKPAVSGQKLIRNIKKIQQKLGLKDSTQIPVIFDEVKRNQLIRNIIHSKNIKNPDDIKTPQNDKDAFMETLLDNFHRTKKSRISNISSNSNQNGEISPEQSLYAKNSRIKTNARRYSMQQSSQAKVLNSKEMGIQKLETFMVKTSDDELMQSQPPKFENYAKHQSDLERDSSEMSYDLEEDTEQEFTEYQLCDADDSRRNSQITDFVILRDASSISGDVAQSSIEAHLNLGSSISPTPSKSKSIAKLKNLDFENYAAKSSSFSNSTKKQKFYMKQVSSNQDYLVQPDEYRKKKDSMTPKSAQINKSDEKLQKRSKYINKDRNSISLSISKNNSAIYSETPISKSISFQNNKKDSNDNESQDDFTKYLNRNKQETQNENETVKSSIQKYHYKNSSSFSPVTASHILNRVSNEESKKLMEDMYSSNKGFKTPGNYPNLEFNQLAKKSKENSSTNSYIRFQTEDNRFAEQPKSNETIKKHQQNIPQQDLLSPFSHSHKKKKMKKNSDEDDEQSGSHSNCNSHSHQSPSNSDVSSRSHQLLSQYTISTSSCISQNRGKKWQINQYEVLQDIGKGKFATVKKIRDKETKKCYAMKIINKHALSKKKLTPQKTQFTQVEKEVAIMKKMGHPYIVKLIEIIDDPNHNKQFLIQEYVSNGDLMKKIKNQNYTEAQVRKYFRQLISAVWYCHEVLNIFHRDIKPDNILIDEDDNIKLTDFGVSEVGKSKKLKHSNDHIYGNAGSHCYFCPEACNDHSYSGKDADLWACAITLYQMVYAGELPFISASNNIRDLQSKIINQDLKFNNPCFECEDISSLKDLLQKMLTKDPTKRITIIELQKHPWLTHNGKETSTWASEVDYIDFQKVTDEEVSKAMTSLTQFVNMKFMKKKERK